MGKIKGMEYSDTRYNEYDEKSSLLKNRKTEYNKNKHVKR